MSTINHHHALVYIMVMVSAADRAMSDNELGKIGRIVQSLPVFAGFSPEKLLPTAQECAAILESDEGLDTALGLAKEALTPLLRETAYALAVEVAAADMQVGDEERRLLHIIRSRLDVDPLVAAAVERAAIARHRTA